MSNLEVVVGRNNKTTKKEGIEVVNGLSATSRAPYDRALTIVAPAHSLVLQPLTCAFSCILVSILVPARSPARLAVNLRNLPIQLPVEFPIQLPITHPVAYPLTNHFTYPLALPTIPAHYTFTSETGYYSLQYDSSNGQWLRTPVTNKYSMSNEAPCSTN